MARAARDAVTPTVRGAFDADESYCALDVVSFDGNVFIARHDDPGICPGAGWEAMSKPGTPGHRGETGARGPRGLKGAQGKKGDSALEIASCMSMHPATS